MTWIIELALFSCSFLSVIHGFTDEICRQHIRSSAEETKVTANNEFFRYPVIKLGGLGTWEFSDASDVCRECFDGTLITREVIGKFQQEYAPIWIGATNVDNNSQIHEKRWFWMNDKSEVQDKQIEFSEEIVYFEKIEPNTTYALFVVATRMMRLFVGWNRYSGRKPLITPIRLDDRYWVYMNRRPDLGYGNIGYLICQRPYRSDCHRWNFTENRCYYNKRFGCHTFENLMHQDGDDNATSTSCVESPDGRRQAKRCPIEKCTCEVTQWSEWADCEPRNCTDQHPTKTRNRKIANEHCSKEFLHAPLSESKPCRVAIECEKLVDPASPDS